MPLLEIGSMDLTASYFLYSVLFMLLWFGIYFYRDDLRTKLLLTSGLIAPMGPLSELWYLRDYWTRETVTATPIGFEDLIFAFALGGIVFSLFKLTAGQAISEERPFPKRKYVLLFFPAVILAFLLVFTNWLGVNSIFSSSAAFLVLTLFVWMIRPDLRWPSLASGVLTLLLFVGMYQIMQLIYPNLLLAWCDGCNPSGVRFLGINLEELLWDFSWGTIGGVLYEVASGRALVDRRRSDAVFRSESAGYRAFDKACNDREYPLRRSILGNALREVAGHILSIRVVRGVTYLLRNLSGRRRSLPTYGSLRSIAFIACLGWFFLLEVIVRPLGWGCKAWSLLWLVYLLLPIACSFAFPRVAWRGLVKLGDSLSSMVAFIEHERSIAAWLHERGAMAPQLVFSLSTGFCASLAAFTTQRFLGPTLAPCPVGMIGIAWTAALGANSVYWLWYVPLLIRKVCSTPTLHLRWHDPVRTEGVRGLSRLLGRSTLLATIGAVLFEMPILYSFWIEGHSAFIAAITVLCTFCVLGTIVFTGFMPQFWLTKAVRKERERILDSLSQDIEQARMAGQDEKASGILDKVSLYSYIADARDATVDRRAVRDYMFAIVLAILPVVLPLLFERKP